ncbi:NAD(P)H-hydrate dehydratase [Leptolyngbya sp. AN03gr2]|uniref:NAD(P)H-hydrate dehydratase n=1 Tax=unclassified Leptolyngbya TaxID=2650499 RepID=UPI003D31191A
MHSSEFRLEQIHRTIVTADQMRSIEHRLFDAGMPVAALMEKVSGRLSDRISNLFPPCKVGVLVGSGHNGGDALVVARELHFRGYEVRLCCPFSRFKELTDSHLRYAKSLGIPCESDIESLRSSDFLIDGLFGFGLTRAIEGPILSLINRINEWNVSIVSIDLPSGLHTDTGRSLGTAIRATYTLCLGLWKLGLLQDEALEFVGQAELIDFDIPLADIAAILGNSPQIQRVTSNWAMSALPLKRPASTHKYKIGHSLLICGSRRYAGGALLTGLGGRSSGVGMLSIAVPESLKPMLSSHLPEALIIGCPETESGEIAKLPDLDLSSFNAIACGPGLTLDAAPIVQQVLESDLPIVLDADGLNALAQFGTIPTLQKRQAATILTPHSGEFKRLFPDLEMNCRATAVKEAAKSTGAIVLLKGARIAIASPEEQVRINPESTPALARGGSGDVLTGLLGGLLAQNSAAQSKVPLLDLTQTAAWWHAEAGILAAQTRTELGVDAHTLTQFLIPAIVLSKKS